MGCYIDFIFQKRLLHYRLPVTQINVETSTKLFHKIFCKMNWSPPPSGRDIYSILMLHLIFIYRLGLSKHIRWPDPPGDPTGTDLKPADLTYSGGRRRIFSTRNRLQRVSFGFSPPKIRKPEPTSEKPIIRRKPRFWRENSRFQR